MVELSLSEIKKNISSGSSIIDLRDPDEFASGFIPGSIFFSEGISLKTIGSFLNKSLPLNVVAGDQIPESVIASLSADGFEIAGVLLNGVHEWKNSGSLIDLIIDVDAEEFAMDFRFDTNLVLVDLRQPDIFYQAHIRRATNIPLEELADLAQIATLDEEGTVYFYGYNDEDALMAASWMKKHGLHNLRVIKGGWAAILKEGSIEVEKALKK